MGIVVLLIWLFLYTQAEVIYGQYAQIQRDTILFYFVLFLIPAVMYKHGLPGRGEGLKSLLPFAIMVVLTLAVMLPLRWYITTYASLELITIALGYGLLHSFVKAYIEELVFRYYLPLVAGLGDVISSILFGLFHFSVAIMTGVPAPMTAIVLLMVMGYLWSVVRRTFQKQGMGAGLAASTGSHFAYNLIALGLI